MRHRSLVTGGAGFLGSHLVDRLIGDGDTVTVLDDFSTGRRENLAEFAGSAQLRIVEGSILDRAAVDRAMRGCDRVFHLAVQCVRRSLSRPIENHEVNATGTLIALEQARQQGVRRFLYCSSSEVYGNCGAERLIEETTLCAPMTVYGAAKLAGEYYTQAYQRTYGVPVTIVRPFNSYGPRAHHQGDLAEVIPRFVIRALNGEPPVIFGSAENGRDFTYVTETVRGIALAAESEAALGHVVNLAFGCMVTVERIAQIICALCGHPQLKPIYAEPRPGDVHALQADTRLARKLLGFSCGIDIADGLKRYVEWFRTQHPNPALLLEPEIRNWEMPDEVPQAPRAPARAWGTMR
jgi:UDP-glucose 4-epimerase